MKTVMLSVSCHAYPRVVCELMLIQGEIFFWHNAPTKPFKDSFFENSENDLTKTICVISKGSLKDSLSLLD